MTLAPATHSSPAAADATEVSWTRDWATAGRCAGQDPDALFGEGSQQRLAKGICARCPVVAECLAEALDNRLPFGVWGGMTERERRALLRSQPDVTSWSEVLRSAHSGEAGPISLLGQAWVGSGTRRR